MKTLTVNGIINDLACSADNYDLAGVEFTTEDANTVLNFLNKGMSYEDAKDEVLKGISNCLSND